MTGATKVFCMTCSTQGELIAGEVHLPCGHSDKFFVPFNDARTDRQKLLWEKLGPPLYYCSNCLLAVKVKAREGQEPLVERPCKADCGHQIMAPRKAITAGAGGLSFVNKVRQRKDQLAAALTGRCV